MTLNVRGLAASPYCEQCPCARDGKPVRPVPAFGGTGSLCIVGEAPGREEVKQGFPFIGPSGKIVNQAIRRAGGDRALVFVVNSLLCQRPPRDDDFDFAVECCRERLRDDLVTAAPTAICALGGTAMKALELPVRFVSQARGTVQESPLLPSVPVIGALHPAALLHGGAGEIKGGKQKMNVDAQAMFLFSDVAKSLAVANGAVPAAWSDDIQVVHEAVDVVPAMEAILADVYEDGVLGIDLEWDCEGSKNALDALGADAHRAIISWVGIGCRKRSVSFKWQALVDDFNERGQAYPEGVDAGWSGLALLQAAMEDPEMPKLAHNKQADKAVWEAQIATFANAVGLTGQIAGQFWDCYLESATEFLTRSGWKRYHQVTKHDRLATVNAFGAIEFQAYRERIARPFSGLMYEIATPYTRAVVTPTHRLWCRPIRRTAKSWYGEALGSWQLLTVEGALASNTDTFEVQRAGRPEGARSTRNSVDLAGAPLPFHAWLDRPWLPWMKLFGIWLTDGTLQYVKGVPRAISISQKKFGHAYELLQELARHFPLHYNEMVRSEPRRHRKCIECTWAWNSTQVAKAFLALFGRYSKERSLPDWVWDLQIHERRELLQAMFLGDSHHPRRTTRYNTFSSALADRVQALALSVGWPATCQHDSGGYHVHVRCEDAPTCQIRSRVQNAKGGRNNGSLKIIHVVEDRKVCFSVPNQRLVTRSGGRPAFHGNSMLIHHVACPGIDHDLQQVASQYLCVPPWKVDHAKRAAEWEAKQKEQAKAEKAKVKEEKKAQRQAEHEARNAEKAAEKAAKKATRQVEHEARNAQLKAEGEARKAERKAAHEARNAAAAADKKERKSRPAPHPKQPWICNGDGTHEDHVVEDLLDFCSFCGVDYRGQSIAQVQRSEQLTLPMMDDGPSLADDETSFFSEADAETDGEP